MTEPVAHAASPRRTVRVAVALLAGQTALCAVIGWVTFGSPQTGTHPPHPVAPLAAPPLAMPTASVALPPPRSTATRAPRLSAGKSAKSVKAPQPPAPRAKERAEPAEEQPVVVIATAPLPSDPAPSPSPDLTATAPPDPPASGEVQRPVVEGETCEPEDALGQTEDDVSLRCVRQEDDRLVWQIN